MALVNDLLRGINAVMKCLFKKGYTTQVGMSKVYAVRYWLVGVFAGLAPYITGGRPDHAVPPKPDINLADMFSNAGMHTLHFRNNDVEPLVITTHIGRQAREPWLFITKRQVIGQHLLFFN